MGLDITAYKQLKPCDKPPGADDGDYDYDRFFRSNPNPNFPGRDVGLIGEWFEYRGEAESRHSFRAGSYSGYNKWRDWLAKLAGYGHSAGAWTATSGPFFELIDFSDSEGTIGPVVSAKLAKDFAEWDERAKADARKEKFEWFYVLYCDWRLAFEMAADGGAVDFH